MQGSNNLCFCPMAEKKCLLNYIHYKMGLGKIEVIIFVVLIFVLLPHSSGESFVRPNVLESLEIQW